MKQKHKIAHMKTAFNYAECSTATRLKVGCVIVKDHRIISIGYNGTPSGWDNTCEDIIMWKGDKQLSTPMTISKSEVLHAETNAIAKLARCSESGEGAAAFVTHQPCMDCAKLFYQSGISEVYYVHEYRKRSGIGFLQACNIHVEQITELGDTCVFMQSLP